MINFHRSFYSSTSTFFFFFFFLGSNSSIVVFTSPSSIKLVSLTYNCGYIHTFVIILVENDDKVIAYFEYKKKTWMDSVNLMKIGFCKTWLIGFSSDATRKVSISTATLRVSLKN